MVTEVSASNNTPTNSPRSNSPHIRMRRKEPPALALERYRFVIAERDGNVQSTSSPDRSQPSAEVEMEVDIGGNINSASASESPNTGEDRSVVERAAEFLLRYLLLLEK